MIPIPQPNQEQQRYSMPQCFAISGQCKTLRMLPFCLLALI